MRNPQCTRTVFHQPSEPFNSLHTLFIILYYYLLHSLNFDFFWSPKIVCKTECISDSGKWVNRYWTGPDGNINIFTLLHPSVVFAVWPIERAPLVSKASAIENCLQCFWHCWLVDRKSIQPVKIEWWAAGMVICLEQGANDLHMVQLMPLPPHHLLLN